MPTKRLVIIGVAVIVVVGVAAASFHVGQRYEAKRDTVLLANEGCFVSWAGLMALNSTNHIQEHQWAQILDSEMDLDAMILADMTLKHPYLISVAQDGLLAHVRDFREKYGRHYQYDSSFQPNPADVDKRIAQALDYLESLGGTNRAHPYEIWHGGSEDAYLDRQVESAKHGK